MDKETKEEIIDSLEGKKTSWELTLETLEMVSKGGMFGIRTISIKQKEKAKELLKDKKKFLKFYIKSLGVEEKENIVTASEQKIEDERLLRLSAIIPILNNPKLTEQKRKKVLKSLGKREKKMKKEIKKLIEWSKK